MFKRGNSKKKDQNSTENTLEKLLKAIKEVQDSVLQFILIMTTIIMLYSSVLAVSFGPTNALYFVVAIIAFALLVVIIDRRFPKKKEIASKREMKEDE